MALLMESFIAEELTPYIRKVVLDAVNRCRQEPESIKVGFEFNRFNITIDCAANIVTIEDALDASPAGKEEVFLENFIRSIGDRGKGSESFVDK